jgi:predicted nucleic acid-binding protein
VATKVLDSWALIAFLEDERAADTVEQLLIKAEAGVHRLLLCVVNWGEIYYNTMREVSQASAEKIAVEVANMPIELVGVETDLALTRQAAVFKATNKLAYSDAFAAALAKLANAELVTGDRDFKALEGQIKIAWLT